MMSEHEKVLIEVLQVLDEVCPERSLELPDPRRPP